MPDENEFPVTEGHDPQILAQAAQILDACRSAEEMGQAVLGAALEAHGRHFARARTPSVISQAGFQTT